MEPKFEVMTSYTLGWIEAETGTYKYIGIHRDDLPERIKELHQQGHTLLSVKLN